MSDLPSSSVQPWPNCSNFTLDDVERALLIRGITGIVCFLLGCLTLIIEIVFLCRTKTNFLLRLFFHLTLSSTLFIGTFGGDLVHYFNYGTEGEGDHGFCEALAFLAVCSATITLLFICTIVLALLRTIYKSTQAQVDRALRKNTCIPESVFVVLAYTLPLFVCWIPLVTGHYGNNRWSYCWFRNSAQDSPCGTNDLVLEEILLVYVPNSVAALFSFIGVIALIVWVIRLNCYAKVLRQKLKIIMKEMFLFIGFLGAYSITWLVFLISSLTKTRGYPHYNLWLLKSLVNPIIVATIPSSFFFYLIVRYYSFRKNKRVRSRRVPRHLYTSVVNRTTPPSTRVSPLSETIPLPFSYRYTSHSSEDSLVLVN